jgi:hypothetical protein
MFQFTNDEVPLFTDMLGCSNDLSENGLEEVTQPLIK